MTGRFNVSKAMATGSTGGVDNLGMELDSSHPTGLAIQQNNNNSIIVANGNLCDSQQHIIPPNENGRPVSFCHLTMEALPRLDYYMNSKQAWKRPSLGELHGEEPGKKDISDSHANHGDDDPEHIGIKLGWIQGVLIPCLLNIWGVMLFLRLSWVVGQSGIFQTLIIIGISALVCVLTTLSLSAISTNGEVKGGGIYYIISRSLGPEFGASVGVIFAFANAVAASMNTIGFCDSLNDLLGSYGLKIIDGGINDVRLVGVIAILVMVLICAVGMEWESKAQNFLVVIIVAAIIDFIVGAIIGPKTDEAKAQGFAGLSVQTFMSNWGPDYRYSEGVDQNFFTVFSIFFPSVTGIQAGANISGDLKDPASAIPKGTMLSLAISMFSYAVFVLFAGGAANRDATGLVSELADNSFKNCTFRTCSYGLMNSYSVMQLMSVLGGLIYAGCFAATLSTALTNLLSVPRLIQALGIDRIYPGLIFFSKGYGKHGEPYRGYVLTFFISSAFVLIAHLNVIAPLISNFYLASYALINFCTFHAALIKPLGWRPTFKYYNMWLSLIGFVLCVVIMFLIEWKTTLLTFVLFFILYLVVIYRNPDVNWGSSTQAQTYKTALITTLKLTHISEHVKNYQPQLLVLSGQLQSRPPLLDFANLITKNNSLLICAEICKNRLSYKGRIAHIKKGNEYLSVRKIKGFFTVVDGLKFEVAARGLMQASGVGKMKPNVLMMGYKNDWMRCNTDDLQTYFNVLHDAFENRLAVAILRLADGLDLSVGQPEVDEFSSLNDLSPNGLTRVIHSDSNLSMLNQNVLSQTSLSIPGSKPAVRPTFMSATQVNGSDMNSPSSMLRNKKKQVAEQILHQYPDGQALRKNVLDNMRIFDKKQSGGCIDVWWLYDDGGLTILLPYILSTRHTWSDCKMRVFALANRTNDIQSEEFSMASLLSKFRINYTSLTMIHNISEPPKPETTAFFNNIISCFRESDNNSECVVTEEELTILREKTNRQLKLRELLIQHSSHANLVLMSLPMPRKGLVSAPLYMAWLEVITRDMPPFLLVRGNQTSVLTFYS